MKGITGIEIIVITPKSFTSLCSQPNYIFINFVKLTRESIESLLIKFADEMTRSLENSFGIKNEFNQLEGIYALDED